MKLSIIITTKNRGSRILKTLGSLINNDLTHISELLIIDQSENNQTQKTVTSWQAAHKNIPLKYIRHNNGGQSEARNRGIKDAKGDVCVFTDDDCIVPENWIQTMYNSFKNDASLSVLFGQVLPFQKTKKPNQYCPSTSTFSSLETYSKPGNHRFFIFTGSNMSVKKTVFEKIGGFSTLVGLGSIGIVADDEEFAFRCLCAGIPIQRNPSLYLFHNRWLSRKEYQFLMAKYTAGFMTAFSYHAILGNVHANQYLVNEIKKIFHSQWYDVKKSIKNMQFATLTQHILLTTIQYWYILRGLCVGTIAGLCHMRRHTQKNIANLI